MDNAIYVRLNNIIDKVIKESEITSAEGRWLIGLDADYIPWLMAGADRIRKTFRGQEIEVCAISNVRSGNCSEDCSFCAQSGHHKTAAPVYNYISTDELSAQAKQAREWGASDFGIVSKGWGIRSAKEAGQLKAYLGELNDVSDIGRCASLGVLSKDSATSLKEMGLENYHHNLECAESFFDQVCTTHNYQDNIDTIQHASDAGLRVCAGGILGMGESLDQRIELADTLRKLNVKSVPLNFLNPQEGTPMGTQKTMTAMEILQTIAVFRYMLPQAEIRIAGGRQFLGDMQSMIFFAGASGIMIGDYLTTKGRSVNDDLKMLADLNLSIRGETQQRRDAHTTVKIATG